MLWKIVKIIGSIIGAIALAFGLLSGTIGILSTTPDVIAANASVWVAWLGRMMATGDLVSGEMVRWVAAIVGLGIIAAFNIPWRRRVSAPLPPSSLAPRSTPTPPVQVVHDGALWTDSGGNYFNTRQTMSDGPLCPTDQSTLRYQGMNGRVRLSATEDIRDHREDIIGPGPYDGKLYCPACSTDYTLVQSGRKNLGVSRSEAEAQLDGLKRQRGSGQE